MEEDKKEVTIYDIADVAGISSATVSRALNDHPAISEKTKKRVQAIARELGYRQNKFASNLRKQKSQVIGLIIHELKSSFTTMVLAGIEKVITRAGYDLLIAHSYESYKREVANAHNLFHKRVDGVIASLSFDTPDLRHFDAFLEKGIPMVFFDRVDEKSSLTKVVIDNYKGGYQATKHLIDQGCRRIVLLTGSQQRNVYTQRFRGYEDALKEAGIPFDPQLVFINDLTETAIEHVAEEVLKMKPLPDAAFITKDLGAALFMKKIRAAGIRVPEDLAIVGFNNEAISRIVDPSLTTIDYPGLLMGEIAATHLINHLQGHSNIRDVSTIVVHSELIIRDSSLKSGKK